MANKPNHTQPQAEAIDGGEGGAECKTKARALLDGSREIALRYLPILLQRMLDNADDTLFELADRSESNVEQNTYFDAMRELRRKRSDLERAFKQGLLLKFDIFWTELSAAKKTDIEADNDVDADHMVLVAEAELEESLAVTSMVAKVKNRCARELYALEARYHAIFPIYHLTIDSIAIGPKALCDVFHTAVKLFDAETKIKLIIYKLFDKYVIAQLSPFYDEVNALFINSGVLPQLKMSIKKRAGGGLVVKRDDSGVAVAEIDLPIIADSQRCLDDAAVSEDVVSSGMTATDDDVLQTLRQLLSYTGDRYTSPVQNPGALTSTEIVAALSNIQQRSFDTHAVSAIENSSIESLKTQLSAEIQSARASQVNVVDNNVIDIVAMLFDFVLEDRNIPSSAKVLLARLQIPLLKVAIADKTFFSQQHHPARCLLNQMAHATLGLDESVALNNNPLLKKIQYIVTRVLEDFDDDVRLFDELLTQFKRFYDIEKSQQEKAKTLTQRRSEKREKQQLTRTWVMASIAEQIDGKEIPEVIYKIIIGPWREVMVLSYLNGGEEHSEWKQARRFVDMLVWSVQPKIAMVGKNKFAKVVRKILKMLVDGLNRISMPTKNVDQVIKALEQCHLATFVDKVGFKKIRVKVSKKQNKYKPKAKSPEKQTGIDHTIAAMQRQLDDMEQIEAALNTPIVSQGNVVGKHVEEVVLSTANKSKNSKPVIDDEHWHKVKDLKLGQWLNLVDENGKKQRAKLAWKSDLLSECTFLNWKFDLVADLSFNDLAHKFRTEHASTVEDLPLFERAVDAVMNALRKKNKPALS